MSNSSQELSPSDWQVEELPFEQLEPYEWDSGFYELDRRPETGYDVVLLFKKLGEKAVLLTRVERNHRPVFDVNTPPDRALNRLNHTFPNVPEEEISVLFPPKTPGQIAA